MEFLKELWAFLRVRKKLWLAPNHYRDVDIWRFADTCARFCSCAFHIHSLLGLAHVYLRYFCLLSRQRCMLA